VFATPQREDGTGEQRVVEGPGPLVDSGTETETGTEAEAGAAAAAAAFATVWAAAELAANDGLVKQTFVIDARERIEVDARHGHLKQRTLDDQTLAKVMGGKDRALRPDRSSRLLRAIGIMNADGTISARNAKKYKQVNHFVELCRPLWAEPPVTTEDVPPVRVVDLACGNSYLSFVVLEALALEDRPARLLGVDLREDVIETSRARAAEIGFEDRVDFLATPLEQLDPATITAKLGGRPDLAISLHACDTATDAALALAIHAGVESILCVPCCQAEIARQLADVDSAKARRRRDPDACTPAAVVPAAIEHGLLRRTLGEVLTDGLRVEMLEACGYTVATVEFVASTHTPKNLLLRALRSHSWAPSQWRLDPIRARCDLLGVDPALLRALTRLQQAG
jgi:hypothetical protein